MLEVCFYQHRDQSLILYIL